MVVLSAPLRRLRKSASELPMIRTSALVLTAILLTACAPASPERSTIDDAAAAMGGVERIRSLTALEIVGSGIAPNAGQNRMPDDELPVWRVSDYTRTIDLANGRTRVRQVRDAQFLFAGATVQRVAQGLDEVAYNVAADGSMTRVSDAAAKERRIELLHHPLTAVRAALDPGTTIANLRQEGGDRLIDLTTAKGDTVTLAVDSSTNLPSRVMSMSGNANMGDVAIVTSFSDYEDVDGVRLPRRVTTMMDKYLQLDLQVSSNRLNGGVADLSVPADVKSAAAPPPPAVVVTAEPVAKGIWWLAGSGNHRSVVFEFADHLVLYEVPLNEGRSKAVIDKARTLSAKPLTKAIVSHHHFDHSGGLRVAVAEGLTIITHRANEAFFNDLLARKHTIVPDALQMMPRPATFEWVDDRLTLKDAAMEVQLYHLLDNPREGTNVFAYVPRERILVQADLYDASWQQHLWGENVLANLAQRKLDIERSVPVHGVIEPFDQMVRTIKAKPAIPGTT